MKFSEMNWDAPNVVEAIARGDILVSADGTIYQVLGKNGQGVIEGKVLVEQSEQHPAGFVRPIMDDPNAVVFQNIFLKMKRIIHGEQVICSTSAGYLLGTFHCAAEGAFIDFGFPEAFSMHAVYAPFR